jgi:hypothetical protein
VEPSIDRTDQLVVRKPGSAHQRGGSVYERSSERCNTPARTMSSKTTAHVCGRTPNSRAACASVRFKPGISQYEPRIIFTSSNRDGSPLATPRNSRRRSGVPSRRLMPERESTCRSKSESVAVKTQVPRHSHTAIQLEGALKESQRVQALNRRTDAVCCGHAASC